MWDWDLTPFKAEVKIFPKMMNEKNGQFIDLHKDKALKLELSEPVAGIPYQYK